MQALRAFALCGAVVKEILLGVLIGSLVIAGFQILDATRPPPHVPAAPHVVPTAEGVDISIDGARALHVSPGASEDMLFPSSEYGAGNWHITIRWEPAK